MKKKDLIKLCWKFEVLVNRFTSDGKDFSILTMTLISKDRGLGRKEIVLPRD